MAELTHEELEAILSSFLDIAERQIGTANEEFAEYVLEHLGIAIINVISILQHLRAQLQGNAFSNPEHVQVAARYCQCLTKLVDFLRHLL